MKTRLPKNTSILAVVGICSLSACFNADPSATDGDDSLAQVESTSTVRTVHLQRLGDDEAQRAQRIQRFGKLLLGRDVAPAVRDGAARSSTGSGQGGGLAEESNGLRITHLQRNDDTLVVNGEIADEHTTDCDVGEEAAREVFEQTVAALQAERAPEVQSLDLANVHVSRLKQAAGRLGQPDTLHVRVKQYIFSAPRVANGLPVLDSSFSVGVHRSGEVASIRSTGTVTAEQADTRPSRALRRRASSSQIEDRIKRDFPDAGVHLLGLQYAPAARAAAADLSSVEPVEVYTVFAPLAGSSGRSRGMRVAYSVTSPDSPAIYLDAATRGDKGDPRK